jgi:exopolysaccharide biosynthesis polyprenyl glycosylphosphotransferase
MTFHALRRPSRLALEVVVDVVLINAGFVLAYWIRYHRQWPAPVAPENYRSLGTYLPMSAILTMLLIAAYVLQRAYSQRRGRTWLDEAYALLNGTTIGTLSMIVITYFLPALSYSRTLFPLAAVIIFLLLTLSRIAKNLVLDQMRRRGMGIRNVLVVGAGEVGRAVMRTIAAHPELGYRVEGFVDDDAAKGQTDLGRMKALGNVGNIPNLVGDLHLDVVIITLPWAYHQRIRQIVRQCEHQRLQVYIVPDLLQTAISRVDVEQLGEVPVISMREEPMGRRGRLAKRIVDIIGALSALVLSAPIMLLSAMAIKLDSPGPVIFRQTRLGEHEKPFTCLKFRTMRCDAEAEKEALIAQTNGDRRLFKMKDDPRTTRVGRILRRFSIDEYPQFFNVLRGEMSLIGPRPPLPSEVELYQEWHHQRLDVPTGMSGMSQVSGRSDLSFDEVALLDIWYAENWSLLLDLKIMLKTGAVMFLGRGAY